MTERNYPQKKLRDLTASEVATIRGRVAQAQQWTPADSQKLAEELGVSWSQVSGVIAAMSKGQ